MLSERKQPMSYEVKYRYNGGSGQFTFVGLNRELARALRTVFSDPNVVYEMSIKKLGIGHD